MTGIRSIIRKCYLRIKAKYSHIELGLKCDHIWYGNAYGGFYAAPDLINEKSVVYSFGIGEDISFDKALTKDHNCHIFCFDPTPKSINWIKRQELNDNFHFYEYGLYHRNEFIDFYLPQNADHVSGSAIAHKNVDVNKKVKVEMKSLSRIMNELGHKHIDVLKMDIESSEYDVIENILDEKISVTQILIEFHGRFFKNGTAKTRQAIDKLKKNGYKIFGISDSLEEISFIKLNS